MQILWRRRCSCVVDLKLASKFLDFEDIIAKIDSENRELFLLGDINVDLLPEVEAPSARKLKDIFDVYGLHQLHQQSRRRLLIFLKP